MAVPVLVQSSTGVIITAAATPVAITGATVGNVLILHYLVDGTGAGIGSSAPSGFADLAGTANSLTPVSDANVGTGPNGVNSVSMGRATATTATVSLSTTGADIYARWYEFSGVSTGTTITTVYENGSAGAVLTAAGTGTSVADVAVTTLGTDRIALNFVAIDDDATGIAAFAGASGGTWAMPSSFESATGTDGTIAIMTASMAAAGTIDGGADTITSDNWGVIGLALIPGVAPPATYQPRHGFVDHANPGVF